MKRGEIIDCDGELDINIDDDSYGDEPVFAVREAPTMRPCPTCRGTGRVRGPALPPMKPEAP